MKSDVLSLILAGLFAASSALAAGDPPADTRDPVLEKFGAATKQQDWAGAASVVRTALAANPNNADYHNLYAYSIRKSPNPDMNLVFKHYNEALRIDPKHRGAHEYIGEAYLMVGNLPKAKEHLSALDKLCFFPCQEHTDLKKAITAYETKR